MPTPTQLILASASPRRQQLLAQLGLSFSCYPAQVVEHEEPDSCPVETVEHNAHLKANWVFERHPGDLVLGADTTVAIDGEVLHKPADMAVAADMLRRLSGRTHRVHTGVALLGPGLRDIGHVCTSVTFKVLSDADIEAYFALVNPLDKAGAYGIQEGRERIIENVEGCVSNVMGLPTTYLMERLQHFQLPVLPRKPA